MARPQIPASRWGTRHPAGWDAELRMAADQGWEDWGDPGQVMVFLERRDHKWPDHGVTRLATVGNLATAWADRQSLRDIGKTCNIGLAHPLAPPRRAVPDAKAVPLSVDAAPPTQGQHDTLIGFIDDGCPFAHAAFRKPAGGTRVVALWDQNGDMVSTAPVSPNTKYGREWHRGQLEALMARHVRDGQVDEAACYRDALLVSLAFRHTHGAFVAGRMAGSSYWIGGRPRPGYAAGTTAMNDPAAAADLAMVQLPLSALQTVSPAAVAFHAFNGVDYLIRLARRLGYQRLVIALAYESYLGPHDTTSWFERALDQLLAEANQQPDKLRVRMVLAAGNSRREAAHAQIDRSHLDSGANSTSRQPLHFHLAPGTEQATWLELWLPKSWKRKEQPLQLRVKDPSGQRVAQVDLTAHCRWPFRPAQSPALSVYGDGDHEDGVHRLRRRILLRFAPTTVVGGGPVARHGLWLLQLVGDSRPKAKHGHRLEGHAYIVRGAANMNRATWSRQARTAFLRVDDRYRTVSGLAGGRQVIVAGSGYPSEVPYRCGRLPTLFGRDAEFICPRAYAGYAGVPSRGYARGPNNLIDAVAATEDGVVLPGQLGMGSRGGTVFRMTGTSVAVPTLVRWLVGQSSWPPCCPGALSGHLGGHMPQPYEIWKPTSVPAVTGSTLPSCALQCPGIPRAPSPSGAD